MKRDDLQLVAVLEHDLLEVRLQAQVRLAALELVHLEQDRALWYQWNVLLILNVQVLRFGICLQGLVELDPL